ncbi:hypothetical protein ACQWHL_24835, partial [Salmonella enterica subsp. enterica serovar Infantis]
WGTTNKIKNQKPVIIKLKNHKQIFSHKNPKKHKTHTITGRCYEPPKKKHKIITKNLRKQKSGRTPILLAQIKVAKKNNPPRKTKNNTQPTT